MSKRTKQVTNAKRARRLGTWAGIAPSRGGRRRVSPWALIGAAAVLAVLVVGVAFAVEGGGGPAGQRAACVQSRLSHEPLDPLSLPTWPANYENLSCALAALNLQPSAEASALTHYHVHLTLYVGGRRVRVPDYIGLPAAGGMSAAATSEIHTHGRETDPVPGVIHIESPSAGFQADLLQFFDVWGVYASPRCLGGDCTGVRAWINGAPVKDWLTRKLHEHDAVTLVVGTPPRGFAPDRSFHFVAGE